MIEKIIHQLTKLDEAEHLFGKEFLDVISYGTSADAYLVKVYDYHPLILNKDSSFESNYYSLIYYLTEMKNRHMNESDPENVTSYYRDWLIFKRNYNVRMAWFYLNINNINDSDEITNLFINIIGTANYHAITNLFHTPNEDYRGHANNVMEYVGNTRAIRNLCMKYLDPKYGTQWQFHLWHLTPTTIIENYGYVFYLGNEMDKLKHCPYDYRAQEYYYNSLYHRLYDNMSKDIPKNEGITKEQKEKIWAEMNEDVF